MESLGSHVWVICERTGAGDINLVEAYTSNGAALEAAGKMSSVSEIKKIPVKSDSEGQGEGGKVKTSNKRKTKSPASYSEQKEDEEDELAGGDASPADSRANFDIPDGIPGVLEGLKLLFTGTMERNRKDYEATAEQYGATLVKKLDETDYIVLGTKPGPKKVIEINEKNLRTITESQFLEMLKTGSPQLMGGGKMIKSIKEEDDVDVKPARKKQKK